MGITNLENSRGEDDRRRIDFVYRSEVCLLKERIRCLQRENLALKRKFQGFVEASALISWTADRDGVVKEESPGWSAYTGQSKEDFIANRWLEMVHPDDRARANIAWTWAYLRSGRYEINYRLHHAASGEWRWVRARGVPLLGNEGAIEGWIGKVDDIHEKVMAEHALARKELQFRSLAETVPAFVWLATSDAQVFYWNSAWYQYTGFSEEQSMGINAANAIREDYRSLALEEWGAAVREHREFEMDFPVVGHTGEARWFKAKARPIFSAEGAIVKWAGTMVDINDHEQMIAELKSERQLRERFVATLSHDLKNALTSGKTSVQMLLRRGSADSFQEKHHRIILRCLDRIDQMTTDLLDANRIRAGNAYPIKAVSEVSAREVVSDVCENLNHAHGQHFRWHGAGDARGRWNSGDIVRLLENLAINALKYGDRTHPITISFLDAGDSVKFRVHNFGNPISPDKVRSLFDFMVRNRSDEGKAQGWGVGLTLVKGITEAYGGTVSVASELESGTTFEVCLPLENRDAGN